MTAEARPGPPGAAPKRIGPGLLQCWVWAVTVAAIPSLLLMGMLHDGWPLVGFDFSYFLPRLIDVRLHQLQAGWWRVQWWTPSFGAGLPAFANPQHTQFMLAQQLVPWLGLWGAAVAQAGLLLFGGTLLVFHACFRLLGCGLGASLVAAATFATSGVIWGNALVGHMTVNVFPLVAILPWVMHRGVPAFRGVAILGIAGAVIILGGGYTVILIFALSALILCWLLPLAVPENYGVRESLVRLIGGGVAGGAAAAAKIAAVLAFLRQFPRVVNYVFPGAGWNGPAATGMQVLGLRTVALASRWLPISMDRFRARFGLGDDVGFGPLVAPVLLAGLWLAWRRGAFHERRSRWTWLGLAAAVWLTLEWTLGRGWLWPSLKPWPIFRTLHENHRFAAAFVLPAVLLVAWSWKILTAQWTRRWVIAGTAGALLLTLASVEPYYRDRGQLHWTGFNASTIERTWQRMQAHPEERFPIERVADVRDDAVFLAHASSLKPYEPIFGYGYAGPAFTLQFAAGPIAPLPGGRAWRFDYPPAFVAPALVGAAPFTPLPMAQAAALHELLTRRQPAWPRATAQTFADGLTLAAWAVLLLLVPIANRLPRQFAPNRSAAAR